MFLKLFSVAATHKNGDSSDSSLRVGYSSESHIDEQFLLKRVLGKTNGRAENDES